MHTQRSSLTPHRPHKPRRPRQPLTGRPLFRLGALAGAAALVSAVLVPFGTAPAAEAATPATHTFSSPGYQTWTVPEGVDRLSVTVAGGQGGNDEWHNGVESLGHPGGRGATVSGTVAVSPGDTIELYVAARGGTGATGGGSDSASSGGYGYRSGGGGGSGSTNPFVPSSGQGGGGGGGASALTVNGQVQAIAGGGGGAGGTGVCGGNPGGDAGQPGWKASNRCSTDGGDPGLSGVTSGPGAAGKNAGSSSGQGGGGGGGGGYRGGGGADASTDGGGGGGGGTSLCNLSGCTLTADRYGNGRITITPVHTPVVQFTETSYSAHMGTPVTFSGTVATQASNGGTPTGRVDLEAVNANGDTAQLASVPVNNGAFSYSCTAHCGVDLTKVTTVRANYQSSDTDSWSHASGTAGLTFIDAQTQTRLGIDPTQAVTGQLRDFTATVDVLQPAQGAVTGEVEFWMSNVDGSNETLLGTSSLASNYQASLEAGVPTAGTHRFWAEYTGAPGFTGSQSPKQTLGTDQAETSVTAETTPATTVTGQPFDLEALVTVNTPGSGTPTGEITVMSGTGTFSATLDATGSATVPIDGHKPGEIYFVVDYSGDENFVSSSTDVIHTVERAETTLGLTIDEMESPYGESFTLSSDIAVVAPGVGEVTGAIEFGYVADGEFVALADPVTLEGGLAELTVQGVDAGDYELQARYAETDDFLAAESPLVYHTVYSVEPAVTVTPMPQTSVYSMLQLVVIEVTGAQDHTLPADGEVQLIRTLDDGTEEWLTEAVPLDEAGQAMVELDRLDPDTYNVYAVYSGSNNFESGMSDEAVFDVEQARSRTSLTAEPKATVDEAHTLMVDVTAFAQLELPDEAEDADGAGVDAGAGTTGPEGHTLSAPTTPLVTTFAQAQPVPLVEVFDLDVAPTGTVDLIVDGMRVAADIALTERADGSFTATATAAHTFTEAGTFEVTAEYSGDTYVMPGQSEPLSVQVTKKPASPANAGDALARTGDAGGVGLLAASALLITVGAFVIRAQRRRVTQ